MDEDLIDRLWREANAAGGFDFEIRPRFAQLIAEECAKVCDEFGEIRVTTKTGGFALSSAEAIRAKFTP